MNEQQRRMQPQPPVVQEGDGAAPADVRYGAPVQGDCPPAPVREPAPRKKAGRVWIPIIVVLALVAVIAVAFASCTSSIAGLFAGDDSDALSGASSDEIAIITLDDDIAYDGSECSPEGFKTLLDQAADDDAVKAVVLRVDSGGGTAAAGEEMAEYLRDFSKPVVVSSASINASAAYEVSSQADYIYVLHSTEIGAIGTALQLVDYSDLLEMLGIDVENVTSADSKDSTYGTRELTDEELEHYQQLVDEVNEVFIANVAEGRGVSVDTVEEWATGLCWAGGTAVDMGVADEVGTFEDAIAKAAELAGIDEYETVDLHLDSSGLSLTDLIALTSYSLDDDDIAALVEELSENGSSIE